MKIMTTKRDLRNWVDDATSGWMERGDNDVDQITDAIQADDHPAWGQDWSAYLESLPELTDFLPETTNKIGAWLHTWGEINASEHPDFVSCYAHGGDWIARPVSVTVPDGWHVAMSGGGTLELYTDDGKHVTFVQIASHGKSIQCAGSFGVRWLPMGDAAEVCCPTCGHPMEQ